MNTAWVFDVDGVITDIEQEKITEPLILDSIIKILEKGEPVALNTGRGVDWTQESVLKQLTDKTINKQTLQNLFIVAESGGETATFNRDGSLNLIVDESLKMPSDLDQKVQKLVQTKYSKSMRYEDKKTMITTKIKEGTSIGEYHKNQVVMARDLQRLIDSYGLTGKFKVDISTIGASIMNKNTGKDRGVELILNWLLQKGIKPQRIIAFGDSESDVPMAEKLYQNGYKVELVYVGKNDLLKINYPFKIIKTQNKYSKGTAEFLQNL